MAGKQDFTIGQRAGSWYAFSDNPKASKHIRENGVIRFGTAGEVVEYLADLGFSYVMEPEKKC